MAKEDRKRSFQCTHCGSWVNPQRDKSCGMCGSRWPRGATGDPKAKV